VAEARTRLLEQFDEMADQLRKLESPKRDAVLAELKELRDRFDKHNELPWSHWMVRQTIYYLRRLEDARAHALTRYGHAAMPDDLRELMDRRVIARWKQEPGSITVTLYSNGRINDPAGPHIWALATERVDLSKSAANPFAANLNQFWLGQLTLRWKDAKAPGGYWVDTCTVNFDGLSYEGKNQNGTRISGKLIRDE
jgi:hypothetical protein